MFSRMTAALGICLAYAVSAALPAFAADAPKPDYVVLVRRAEVNRSADKVWKLVGADYCSISVWFKMTCNQQSGSGDVGTVRVLNGTTVEVMVAKTPHSYTYWQTEGTMASASYHGTLAIEPRGADKSELVYTIFYDQAAFPSDAQREAQRQRLMTRFQGAVDTMKGLAESQP